VKVTNLFNFLPDRTVNERKEIVSKLEVDRGAGSRHLVQRWGDGTLCDKTGKPREVEFHCSMVMSDNILFVKEAKTWSYVLVINTPRLCGEPGFRSPREIADQALIKCREIIASTDAKQELFTVPDNDYPQKMPTPKLNLPSSSTKAGQGLGQDMNDLIQKALASIKGQGFQDTSFIIEVVDEDDDEFAIGVELDEDITEADMDRISKALKAAGIDVRGPRASSDDRQSADKKKTGSGSEQSSSSQNSKRGHPSVRNDVDADDEGNTGLDGHHDECSVSPNLNLYL
ncbi:hypothetical protein MPER_06843, partial [Moniliophthora perniciosa FA553]